MRWLLSLLLVTPMLTAAPARAERPLVVELFTSQGCSSCPPADRVLGDLANQPGVLALAFHVDYWDRLGWKDPYSSAEWTKRQRAYGETLTGSRYAGRIYTPQLVIEGRSDAVGSDVAAIRRGMEKARAGAVDVGAELRREAGGVKVSARAAGAQSAQVLLMVVDPPRVTQVPRGENAGAALREARIVRRLDVLRPYSGAALDLTVADPRSEPGQTLALLVQKPDGSIIGAASLD